MACCASLLPAAAAFWYHSRALHAERASCSLDHVFGLVVTEVVLAPESAGGARDLGQARVRLRFYGLTTPFRPVDPLTRCFVLMELSSNQEMRSKANPRSLVFTIGFSIGVVSRYHPGWSGDAGVVQTKIYDALPAHPIFALTTNRARRAICMSLRDV